MKSLWHEYTQNEPSGLRYSQFVEHYHMWRKENGFSKVNFNKWQIGNIPKEDEKKIREWRLSSKRKLPREAYPRPQGGALRPHGNPATFLKT
jgi:hypothetical protein